MSTGRKISMGYDPSNCPHCEYDRCFPGFERGGWMQMGNNGPIVSCPLCNPDGRWPQYEGEAVVKHL